MRFLVHFDSDFIAVKVSSHQTSAKPRSSKCRHFCFLFDSHNYGPTCREAGKGDDPCVTNEKPCNICSNISEEQQIKIKHRCRYVRKQKVSDPCNTSKDDNLDLLGDMVSLEYLPYYCKLFNHIWQLYTLGVGKFFHMLKFDL